MFPFPNNSNSNGNSSTTTGLLPASQRPFFMSNNNDSTSTTTTITSLFNFPSPHIHYEDDAIFLKHLQDILQQSQPPLSTNDVDYQTVTDMAAGSSHMSNDVGKEIPKKRSSKKDRHSKIHTANGPRDRRMRLSLEVAREFFGLQDVLGFDKASKTVDWLLTKSKTAIDELARGFPHRQSFSESSTSECEVISGNNQQQEISITATANRKAKAKPSCTKEKKSRGSSLRKTTAFHPLARESRAKARARARERTIRARRPVEESVEESGTQGQNIINNHSFEVEETTISSRDSFLITGNWSPSAILNCQNNNAGSSHELQHQFMDIQAYVKSWEGYNN